MTMHGEGALAHVSKQLSRLEKRDWELWVVVSLAGMLVSVGLLSLLFFSAAFKGDTVHFELTLSRPLIIGLFVLLALLNTYLVTKRFEVRRLREQLISATLQNQVTEQQSFIDPLTEIYNRRSLDGIAGRLISQAKRRKTPLSLMMIDANSFKEINTRFGHLTGDFVLSALAGILKDSVRGSDTVLRYGGDEFLILLADTYAEGADTVADRINDKLNDWNEAGNLDRCTVSVSIGVAEWRDGDTLDMMLDSADRSMYEHKNRQVCS